MKDTVRMKRGRKLKTVWIVNHYAQSPQQPGGTRHYMLAKYLKKKGWKAILITASTELNTKKQLLDKGEAFRHEEIDGVDFLRIKTSGSQEGGIRRLWNMIFFSLHLWLSRATNLLDKPDLIIGSTIHPFAALTAFFLAKRYRVPFFFEIRDLWPQTLIDMGVLHPYHPLTWIFKKIESFLIHKADKVITLLPGVTSYFQEKGFDPKKLIWIPNGIDVENFPFTPQEKENEAWTLVYFGAHGKANGLENLLKAMAVISRKHPQEAIKLFLVGDGPEKKNLMEKARLLQLKQVTFFKPVPKETIPEICAVSDAFVFNLIDLPVFRYGISSNKLFDFMAGGRPILFCCNSRNNPVEEALCGLTVPPESPEALADAILKLRTLPFSKRQRMGQRARSYVEENHDFVKLSKSLASLMEEYTSHSYEETLPLPLKKFSNLGKE